MTLSSQAKLRSLRQALVHLYKERHLEDVARIVELRDRRTVRIEGLKECLRQMAKNDMDNSTLRVKLELIQDIVARLT